MTVPASALPATDEAPCGLRERKKRETRKALHHAALRLAHVHGADAVTVDAVAAEAGVSTRTFFNYFASKEDALVGGDPEMHAASVRKFLDRPADEPVRESIRVILLGYLTALQRDPEVAAMRRRLVAADPVTGARILGLGVRLDHLLVDAAVERARRTSSTAASPRTVELAASVEAYAAIGAIRGAVRAHVNYQGDRTIEDLVDEAYALLGW